MTAHLSILAGVDLGQPTTAQNCLTSIFAAHASLRPTRCGNYEPLRRLEGNPSPGELVRDWTCPFLWTNGQRTRGSIWFSNPDAHDAIYLSAPNGLASPMMQQLCAILSRTTSAVFSALHIRTSNEDEYLSRYEAEYPLCLGLTTHDLRRSIPDLPWLVVLGAPYVDLIGQRRLDDSPCHRIEWIGPTLCLLQLTPRPPSRRTYSEFAAAREALKSHLGDDLFLDLEHPREVRRVPDLTNLRGG